MWKLPDGHPAELYIPARQGLPQVPDGIYFVAKFSPVDTGRWSVMTSWGQFFNPVLKALRTRETSAGMQRGAVSGRAVSVAEAKTSARTIDATWGWRQRPHPHPARAGGRQRATAVDGNTLRDRESRRERARSRRSARLAASRADLLGVRLSARSARRWG